MSWLDRWTADVRDLERLDGRTSIGLDLAIDAAVILVLLVDVMALAAWATGAGA